MNSSKYITLLLSIYFYGCFAQIDDEIPQAICPLENGKVKQKKSNLRYNNMQPAGGVYILAENNNNVRAIMQGVVLNIDTIGNENRIILVKTDDYTTVYSELSHVSVKKGQRLDKGQYIGSINSKEDDPKSHLYLEVWKGINQVNPLEFYQCDK